jgi:CzcA family heavy metal efflux pump
VLAAVIRWSLRYPLVVGALATLLAVYGVFVLLRAKYDVFPEFVPPQAIVQTEAPGMVAEQVEQLVTLPIEQAISGQSGVTAVRSETISGLSIVTVVFQESMDPYRARQIVADALREATERLPDGVKAPKLEPLTSSTMDLAKIGFVSDKLSPMELYDLLQWTVRPRLLAVPGVARATLYGGEQRELEVEVEPRELNARDLSFGDVIAAVRSATGVRGGGFIETPNQRVLIETRGQALTAAALGAAVVPTPAGSPPLHLRDFATVTEAAAPKYGDALIMGKPGALFNLSSQYGANTLDATRAVEAALKSLQPTFAAHGVTVYPALHRPATFIENALEGIRLDVLLGAALIALVLFLFLRDPQTVLVAFVSIPLALFAAVIVVRALGWTINTMTLGGLAVALGVVVDDAIIGVENVVRRLRGARRDPAATLAIIQDASVEVRAPVVYATFVVVLVLAPMLLLTGLQGSFFAPLAASFIFATLASLLVALTVTPAAALLLLTRTEPHPEPGWITRLKAWHERLLGRWTAFPRRIIAVSAAATVLAAAALPLFGSELMPPFREGHFVVQTFATPGISLEAMRSLGERVAHELLAVPGVVTVEQTYGRAESSEDTWEPSRSEFHIELKRMSGRAEEATQQAIRTVLGHYPSLRTEIVTFLGDRLSESLSGESAPVSVNIYGPDLDELDRVADQIADAVRAVPGAADVQVQSPPGAPFLRVDLKRERLDQYGFTATDVLDTVQTAYQGATAAQVYDGNRVTDLVVRLPPAERRDPEAIGALLVRAGSGVTVPLRELAAVSFTEGRTSIIHEGARRRQVVTANPTTSDLAGFVAAAQHAIALKVKLPPDVYLEFTGAAAEEAQARHELLLHSSFAAIGIVLLLAVAFRDARSVILILATMPFALVGGVIAVALTGATLSIGSLVGFVTLFGIVARNAILLIAHVEHLITSEGAGWSLATVLRGTRERVVPILMTALVTALGLLPLAAGSGEAGREVQGPMASVILGGLATSTLMTLLVLPVLVWHFGPLGAAREGTPPPAS